MCQECDLASIISCFYWGNSLTWKPQHQSGLWDGSQAHPAAAAMCRWRILKVIGHEELICRYIVLDQCCFWNEKLEKHLWLLLNEWMNLFSVIKLGIAVVTGFSVSLSSPLSLSFTSKGLLKLPLPLTPFYCHGSKSPECNRNKALSGLICLFLSFRPFFSPHPLSLIGFIKFGCLVMPTEPPPPNCFYEWAPLKVIWWRCTSSSHILLLSHHQQKQKKQNKTQTCWPARTTSCFLPPSPHPPPSLYSNPHGDRRERKWSKVSQRDCRRKREIKTKREP